MNKTNVATKLQALAASNARSKTARLRDVIDDVEAALKAGVPRADILRVLNAEGLDMNLTAFDTTLKRIRQQLRRSTSAPPASPRRTLKSPSTSPPEGAAAATAIAPVVDPLATGMSLEEIFRHEPDLVELIKLSKRK